jgi:uncharacterized protein
MGADTWVVSDGAAGNEKQALALAHALGRQPETVRLDARAPWRWFAPRVVAGSSHAFGSGFARRLRDDAPALAIGCGRQAALALQLLKRAHARCRTVQILDPRVDARRFDVVVVPAHDALRGANVVVARGALHDVDEAYLARARIEWPQFAALPAPRTVVLLGGSNGALSIDEAYWRRLAAKLGRWCTRDGGSLLLSTSRRSPQWLRDAARAEFSAVPGLQWHGVDDGPNPYAGLLAWADRIVVTPDSVNLLSEACATSAPVLVHVDAALRGKLASFLGELVRADRVRPMHEDYAPWAVQPLREIESVAAQVRQRLG